MTEMNSCINQWLERVRNSIHGMNDMNDRNEFMYKSVARESKEF